MANESTCWIHTHEYIIECATPIAAMADGILCLLSYLAGVKVGLHAGLRVDKSGKGVACVGISIKTSSEAGVFEVGIRGLR